MSETNISVIEQDAIDGAKIENLATRPNSGGLYGEKKFSSKDLKKKIDELPLLAVDKVNELITALRDGEEYRLSKNLAIPSVLTSEENASTDLYTFLMKLKKELADGVFARRIKTGKDAQSVLEFLNDLQTQIGDAEDSGEGSLREQIKKNKDTLQSIGNRVDGIVNEVSSDIGEAIEELANFVSLLTGEEIEFPETPIEQPLRKSINNLEERVTTLEKCMDELFEEITDDKIAHVKTIPDDKKILPIGFVTRLGGLSRKTDNLISWDKENRYSCVLASEDGKDEDGNKYCKRGGITYTYDTDAAIIINGTLEKLDGNKQNTIVIGTISLKAGKYVLGSDVINGTSSITTTMVLYNSGFAESAELGTSHSFEISEGINDLQVRIQMYQNIGEKIGMTIKPYLIRTDDKDENEIVEYKYTPYYEGYKHAKVTSIISKDASGNVISKFAIPSEIQNLEGYGLGISKDKCNYIDFETKTYTQMVYLGNDAPEMLEEAVVTDISAHLPTLHCTINLAAGGTVTFESADESGNDIGARCVSELSYLEVNK